MDIEKVVIVTRKTRLEELIERFNTRAQAKFYIEHMGLDFSDYDREHLCYEQALRRVRQAVAGLAPKMQAIERGFLPSFLFTARDLVLTVGPDGLVVNAAKYVDGQPIVAVNPDPARWDGVLLPFTADAAGAAVAGVLEGRASFHRITMAEATLNDGQRLLAFNDFLVGRRTHVSARYRLTVGRRTEEQSSSGVLVSTGAGSTGWFSSARNMAAAVSRLLLADRAPELPRMRLEWGDPRLLFVVREPFLSRSSGVSLAAGLLDEGEALEIESRMPDGGVLFSDGVEADALEFRSGLVATIRAAKRQTLLVAADAAVEPAGRAAARA